MVHVIVITQAQVETYISGKAPVQYLCLNQYYTSAEATVFILKHLWVELLTFNNCCSQKLVCAE